MMGQLTLAQGAGRIGAASGHMVETTALPRTIRTCPNCGAGMVAQRAGRGVGWMDPSLRFLFCCQKCKNQAVLETVNSESRTIIASGFLILVGSATAFYLPLLYGAILGAIFLLIGISSLWIGWRTARMYRPKRGQQAVSQIVEVQDDLFVKEVDKIRSRWMQQYGFRAIYCILLIAAIVALIDWVGI